MEILRWGELARIHIRNSFSLSYILFVDPFFNVETLRGFIQKGEFLLS